MPTPDPYTALQDLRARAERRRLVSESLPADAPAADAQRLVQELQVHQIELEMQYEELRLAQVDAETSRLQYLDLYEFAPVGYCTLSAGGTLSQLNLRTSQLLGSVRQQLLGRRLALFVEMADRPQFAEFLARLWAAPGERRTCELRLCRADTNAPFYAQLEGVAMYEDGADAARSPAGWRLVLLDVSERRRAADELAASEARFRATFEQSTDGMALLEDHRFVRVNEAAVRLLGQPSRREVEGQRLASFWPERQPDGRRSLEVLMACVAEAQALGWCRLEWQRPNAAGQPVWDELSFNPVLVQGRPLLHVHWRDITESRRTTQRLHESEARLSLALAASETGVFSWNLAEDRVAWDARAQAIFGYPFSPALVPVAALHSRFHPADAARVWATTAAAIESGQPLALDYRVQWPDGSLHHVASAGRAVLDERGRTVGFTGILRDATAQRAAEAELNYKTLVLERLLHSTPMILSRIGPDGSYLESVGAGLQALGLADNELVGRSALEEFPAMQLAMRAVLAGSQGEFLLATERAGHPVMLQNYGFFDELRQQAVLLSIDVTQAEQQRRQLLAEKEFSQSLLENSIDGIMALDHTGRITAWNKQATAYFGPPAAEAIGRMVSDVLPHLDPAGARQLVGRVLAGEAVLLESQPFGPRPGQYDAYYVPLRPALGPGVTGVLGLFRDVTERNRLADEATRLKLRQQQAVLAAILTTQEEERRRIAEALHNGLGQLLYGTRLHLDALPASEAVRTCQHLLNEAIQTTRTISYELTPGILEDFGLVAALQDLTRRIPASQLLVDVHLHGLDAPLPATLQIATYRTAQELLNNVMRHAQAREVLVQVSHEDGYLHLSVEDDGAGFDPARPVRRAGLGLASIRTRVNLLGGTLTIKSAPGTGTGVFLTLPVPAE